MGDTDAKQVTFDYVIYNLWGMKDPNYLMRMMATGGRLLVYYTCKESVRKCKGNGEDMVKKFKYKLLFGWYFRYRHAIDDHKNLDNSLPSIEDTWMTDLW